MRWRMVMSDLHIEISEMLEAGINIWDVEEALDIARKWNFPLVAGAIEHDATGYLQLVEFWFDGEGVAA
ncbi:cell division protein (plasmid) [Corynebacterium atypicum]|uniref:Cell division protein n=2 Tax=Corynebacterium atypicum TaxID=191610 RepID=A0ABM5QPE6_9CORY|nr:cell division protein [Corynebacterium atypicum]AIG64916.1 cell division protein [Corynebacterium atypicum]